MVKNPPTDAGDTGDGVRSLGQEDPLEEEMATHSSILAWEVPWTEDSGGLHPWGHKESHTSEQTHMQLYFSEGSLDEISQDLGSALDSMLKSRDITLPTKAPIFRGVVFPVVMFGCESWPIKKAEN